jgi:hypothetical protein
MLLKLQLKNSLSVINSYRSISILSYEANWEIPSPEKELGTNEPITLLKNTLNL